MESATIRRKLTNTIKASYLEKKSTMRIDQLIQESQEKKKFSKTVYIPKRSKLKIAGVPRIPKDHLKPGETKICPDELAKRQKKYFMDKIFYLNLCEMVDEVKKVTYSKLTKSERADLEKKKNQEKIKQEQEDYKRKMKLLAEKREQKNASQFMKSTTMSRERHVVDLPSPQKSWFDRKESVQEEEQCSSISKSDELKEESQTQEESKTVADCSSKVSKSRSVFSATNLIKHDSTHSRQKKQKTHHSHHSTQKRRKFGSHLRINSRIMPQLINNRSGMMNIDSPRSERDHTCHLGEIGLTFAQSVIKAQNFTIKVKNQKSIKRDYIDKMIKRQQKVLGINKIVKSQILSDLKPSQGVFGLSDRLSKLESKYRYTNMLDLKYGCTDLKYGGNDKPIIEIQCIKESDQAVTVDDSFNNTTKFNSFSRNPHARSNTEFMDGTFNSMNSEPLFSRPLTAFRKTPEIRFLPKKPKLLSFKETVASLRAQPCSDI